MPGRRLRIASVERGTPKLVDFGISKLLEAPEGDSPTITGLRMMTPRYASPEQVRGEPVTTASDVYSLGVILYEMLAGQSPYAAPDGLTHELMRAVCEEAPARPSAGQHGLRGDLDNIVLMALRKDPELRYASAVRTGVNRVALLIAANVLGELIARGRRLQHAPRRTGRHVVPGWPDCARDHSGAADRRRRKRRAGHLRVLGKWARQSDSQFQHPWTRPIRRFQRSGGKLLLRSGLTTHCLPGRISRRCDARGLLCHILRSPRPADRELPQFGGIRSCFLPEEIVARQASASTARFVAIMAPLADARGSVPSRDRKGAVARLNRELPKTVTHPPASLSPQFDGQ
jgi:hypothetical protein